MIKTNITYGLIVLITVATIVLLLAKIVEVLEAVGGMPAYRRIRLLPGY